MGQDKSQLVYRDGQTELSRLIAICRGFGLPVSVSVREGEDAPSIDASFIQDRFLDLGPMGAICSAFLHDPNAAWLVLACDLPLLDRATIETLIAARRPDKVATALRSPEQQWPEPLVAIYEPRAYPRLLQFLSLGYSCPRKLLINSEVEVITLADAAPVTNANTPAEREAVLQRLSRLISKTKGPVPSVIAKTSRPQPLATNIIHPNHTLEPGDLDAFLERGWRPTGQSIYTSDYLRTDDDELHGCVQIRLPLHDFTFKKRHRKLLKRNGKRFRLVHEPVAGMPDQELLNVNRLYMADHPEKTREDLEYNVINDLGQRVLNTQVLRVYDRHRLAAFKLLRYGAEGNVHQDRYLRSGIQIA